MSESHGVSLCMIVRDAGGTLRPCLESIAPWVDEIVIIDTGSVDDTLSIAKEFADKVDFFPWCDDFSAARNVSIAPASMPWVFWMDADDTISEACGRQLRELAHSDHPSSTTGFVMQVHCPGKNEDGVTHMTAVDHIKMFRNDARLQFEGRIHEQILMSIRRMGGDVVRTDIHVVHSGSDPSEEGRRRKHERDLRILDLDLKDRPNHPFVLFNLGMTHVDAGNPTVAIKYFERCIEHSDPGESHVRKAYSLLTTAYINCGDAIAASSSCDRGLRLYPNDAELLFYRGNLEMDRRDLPAAAESYQAILRDSDQSHFESLDVGIRGYKTRLNLASALTDMGDRCLAESQLRQLLSERPEYVPAWRALSDIMINRGMLSSASVLFDSASDNSSLRTLKLTVDARVAQLRGDGDKARQLFLAALESDTDESHDVLQSWCRFLFETGNMVEARDAITKLTQKCPEDAAAWHNLGSVLMYFQEVESAADALNRSLALRPDHAPTQDLLAQLLTQNQAKADI